MQPSETALNQVRMKEHRARTWDSGAEDDAAPKKAAESLQRSFQKAFGKNDKNDKKNDRALPGFQNMRIK